MNNKHKVFYSHIVAVAQNNTISKNGTLPWHIPEDLHFFKKKTQKKIIIMGRKTFESLKQPLPHRLHIIISRNTNYQSIIPKGVLLFASLKQAYQFCNTKADINFWGKEVFIIGGGEIYKQSLNQVTFIYLTRIHKNYSGDVVYPDISPKSFKEINRIDKKADPNYSFITYKNIILN